MSTAVLPTVADGAEEGIMVAIRMRPLNSKESSSNTTSKSHRVWRVLQKYNSVTQCTAEGKPLDQRIQNRNFFTYDKTFGEGSTTRQVYDEVAKGIVGSVTNGLNGTIFAYGQTSSGKTYTMQGSGSIDTSNINNNGGIVHQAASDIFKHIETNTDRVFLVRVSFIEIYNEEVRDLLVSGGDDNALSVREDPRRGVFVNSNETIVTGLDSLLSVLWVGEKHRSVASTGMNERSSRSHTIFRITVESRSKSAEAEDQDLGSDDEMEEADDGDELSNGNGAVRVSTLNLVDLAGSESVRHTGATGDRQKEGGKINQSLLTLSRVISSLGQNTTHVNFRDSKLTRILQPSLSGNARMAVICCATPSELYLEETRSTLQFASRAKLVKTRAQVNEVIDDRSLIKKLQRELREAKAGVGHVDMEQIKALEEKAVNEAEAKRKAESELKRMKDLILKGGILPMNISCDVAGKSSLLDSLFEYEDNVSAKTANKRARHKRDLSDGGKRRFSDGGIKKCPSPIKDVSNEFDRSVLNSPKSSDIITKIQAKTEIKPKKPGSTSQFSIKSLSEENDIDLLRQALAAKSSQAQQLKSQLCHTMDTVMTYEQKLQSERGEKEMVRLAKHDLEHQIISLASDKVYVMTEQDIISGEKNVEIDSYIDKLEQMISERKEKAENVDKLNDLVRSLQNEIEATKKDHISEVEILTQEHISEMTVVQSEILALRSQIDTMRTEYTSSTESLKEGHYIELQTLKDGHERDMNEMKLNVDALRQQTKEMSSNHTTGVENMKSQHAKELEEARSEADASRGYQIKELKSAHDLELEALKTTHNTAMVEARSEKEAICNELSLKEQAYQAQNTELEEAKSSIDQLLTSLKQVQTENATVTQTLASITTEKEELATKCAVQSETIQQLQAARDGIEQSLKAGNTNVEDLTSQITELNSHNTNLTSEKAALQKELDAVTETNAMLEELIEEMKHSLKNNEEKIQQTESHVATLEVDLERTSTEKDTLSNEIVALQSAKATCEENLVIANSQLESLQAQHSTLSDELFQLEVTKAELVKVTETNADLSSTNDILKSQLADAVSQGNAMDANMKEMDIRIKEFKQQLATVTRERNDTVEMMESLETDKDSSAQILAEMTSKINELEGHHETLQKERDELQSQKEENITEYKRNIERLETELQCQKESSDAQIALLNSQISKVVSELDSTKSEKYAISSQLETCTSNLASLQDELSNSASKISQMESKIPSLISMKDAAEARTRELLEGDGKSIAIVQSLQSEKAALVARVEETIARLDREKEEAQSTIANLTSSIADLQKNNDNLSQALTASKSEICELMSHAEKSEADYTERLKELENAIRENEEIADKLANADLQIAKLEQQVSPTASGDSLEQVTAMKEEIDELKILLASSNTSVEEARNAALEADQELEEKELQLNQALRDLASATEKVRIMESNSGKGQVKSESAEELLNEMEVLMNEKVEAESRLEAELRHRKEFEDELLLAADEDKNNVINEAEEKIVGLREQISVLRSDLSRVESELYTIKDENEDLRDQSQRAESKVRDTECKIIAINKELDQERETKRILQQELDQLHKEADSFKSQAFEAKDLMEAEAANKLQIVGDQLSDALSKLSESQREVKHLNQTIEDLSSDIEEYRQQLHSMKATDLAENDIKTSRLREELAKVKVELSTLNADYLSAKSELTASKEKIAQVKAREHEKCQHLAEKAKSSIEDLQKRLSKAEYKVKQGGSSSQEIQSLKDQLEEVNSAIKEKDARISKLEKTKMTKDQIGKIRLIQEERMKYMTEAKDYKQRVEDLEQELSAADSKPRRKGLRERTADGESDDLTRLQDELKNCNLKLKKYVQHCERLEKERSSVMSVITACDVEDVVGNSVEEMITSLCEKLASVEEECDALANSEDKAAGYLADLDSLRQKYSDLENQLQFYKEANEELSNSHADCKASLKRAQEKISSLSNELKSLQASNVCAKGNMAELQSEQRRQMQWLEKENLQLGDELKKTKAELVQTKSQLDSVQKDSFGSDEATEDLFGLGKFMEATSAQRGSVSKRVADLEQKNLKENLVVKKRHHTDDVALEKENNLNGTARSPFLSSAKKQRKTMNPFSSVKKASRKLMSSASEESSPKHIALGEECEHTTEMTSECKQS